MNLVIQPNPQIEIAYFESLVKIWVALIADLRKSH